MSKYAPNLVNRTVHTQSLGPLFLERALAQGTHGTLYHAVAQNDASAHYAVKHIPNAHIDPSLRHVQYVEADVHRAVSDLPHVVHMHEACAAEREDDGWFLIMEYVEHGDLYDWLLHQEQEHGLLHEKQAKWLLLQLLDTMVEMHARGIYHRDLKPENILISSDHDHHMVLKITDFGMAITDRYTTERGCGSLIYMPPEALESSAVCKKKKRQSARVVDVSKHDVWAMGQIALNLFLALSAWHSPMLDDVCYAYFVQNTSTNLMRYLRISPEFNAILVQCFQPSPDARPNMAQLRDWVMQCECFTVTQEVFEERRGGWPQAFYGFQEVEFDSGVDVEDEFDCFKEPTCQPWSPVKAARKLKSKIGAVIGRKSSHM